MPTMVETVQMVPMAAPTMVETAMPAMTTMQMPEPAAMSMMPAMQGVGGYGTQAFPAMGGGGFGMQAMPGMGGYGTQVLPEMGGGGFGMPALPQAGLDYGGWFRREISDDTFDDTCSKARWNDAESRRGHPAHRDSIGRYHWILARTWSLHVRVHAQMQ